MHLYLNYFYQPIVKHTYVNHKTSQLLTFTPHSNKTFVSNQTFESKRKSDNHNRQKNFSPRQNRNLTTLRVYFNIPSSPSSTPLDFSSNTLQKNLLIMSKHFSPIYPKHSIRLFRINTDFRKDLKKPLIRPLHHRDSRIG